MKKIASLLMGFIVLVTATFAQPKMQSKKEVTKVEKSVNPSKAPKLKKDGTLDKRFKAGKTAEGPMKKDGTPDKRFKKNQPAVKKAA